MIQLGDRVRDRVTGFRGIVVCMSTWLNGCVRCGVQAERVTEDGTLPDTQWIDEPQLEVIASGAVFCDVDAGSPLRRAAVGGPRPDPSGHRPDPGGGRKGW